MKKRVIRSDGQGVTEVEGTPEEIAEFERMASAPPLKHRLDLSNISREKIDELLGAGGRRLLKG